MSDEWMFAADHGQLTFRWAHVLAGVVWIGLLYFFNWVHGPFAGTLDPDTRQRVAPELLPRALHWFRWGAAWTWGTGICLLFVMYYVRPSGLFFDPEWRQSLPMEERASLAKPSPSRWGPALGLLFAAYALYDPFFRFLGTRSSLAHALCVLVSGAAVVLLCHLMRGPMHLSGRAAYVHVGAILGTCMAANVWMRIWPAQRRIVLAVRDGRPPDLRDAALAAQRSKHNTYMSVPLLFLMLSPDQGRFGGDDSAQALAAILLVSWLVTFLLYRQAARVRGF